MSTVIYQAALTGNFTNTQLVSYVAQSGDVNATFDLGHADSTVSIQAAGSDGFYVNLSSGGGAFYYSVAYVPGSGVGSVAGGITIDVKSLPSVNGGVGPILAWQNYNNFIWIALSDANSTSADIYILQTSGGTQTTLATIPVTIAASTTYYLQYNYLLSAGTLTIYFGTSSTPPLVGSSGGYSVALPVIGYQVGLAGQGYQTSNGSTGLVVSQSYATYSPPAGLTAGTLSNGTVTFDSVPLSLTSATYGTSPYTYTYKRGTDGVTFGTTVATHTGQTSSDTFTDTTVAASSVYYYEVVVTDAASGTATSNIVGPLDTPSPPSATAVTISQSATSGYLTNAVTVTVTPNGYYTGTVTVTPSGGGLSTPHVFTFSASATPQSIPFTPTATGTVTFTETNSGSLTNTGSPLTYMCEAQTLSVSPTTVGYQATTTLTFTGGGTHYLTTPPTYTEAGVAGVSFGAVTVNSDTSTTVAMTCLTSTGTATITDPTTGATTAIVIVAEGPCSTGGTFALAPVTPGYTVYNVDGSTYQARNTTVTQIGSSYSYTAQFLGLVGVYYNVIWDDGATPVNYLDIDRTWALSVTVGGYAAGQDPASLVLASPAYKLATTSDGHIELPSSVPSGYATSANQTTILTDLGSLATTAGQATILTDLGTLATASALNTAASTILAAISPLATSSQIPANLTTSLFASAGVFSTGALANAPGGSGGVNVTQIGGSTSAANALLAMCQAVFLGAVSSDASPSATGFTANTSTSTGLSTVSGRYSSPGQLMVMTSGAGRGQTAKITSYTVSGSVGAFGWAAMEVVPSEGDTFMILSLA